MSSNFSTSYNISQSGDLYTLQDHKSNPGQAQYNSTRGTTINAPVNYRKLMAFKGLDNEFYFYVKNQDRKPIYIDNLDIIAALVNRETKSRELTKKCYVSDSEIGTCRLILTSSDIRLLDTGLYDLVLTYEDERGNNLPLYIDLNLRPNYTLEVSGAAQIVPLITQEDKTFLSDGNNYMVGSRLRGPSFYNKENGLVTLAVYCTGYTGRFYLQGTTSEYPSDTDWFNLELGAAVDYYQFINYTGIEPFSFKSNLKFLRTQWQDTGNGTVDKVVIRV